MFLDLYFCQFLTTLYNNLVSFLLLGSGFLQDEVIGWQKQNVRKNFLLKSLNFDINGELGKYKLVKVSTASIKHSEKFTAINNLQQLKEEYKRKEK